MAMRRMFSKSITNSSQFLMMPQSSQNLYFHLGMNADDDGYCEHFTIMRMTESKPGDLQMLHEKGFVNIFDDRVLIILDWKENNYLRSDRYTPSKYLGIYKQEIKKLSHGIPDGIPAVNTGKDRIGKDRLVKVKKERKKKDFIPPLLQEVLQYITKNNLSVDGNYFYKYFTEGNWIDSRGNKVKNWKQKLLTWNENNSDKKPKKKEWPDFPENYGLKESEL